MLTRATALIGKWTPVSDLPNLPPPCRGPFERCVGVAFRSYGIQTGWMRLSPEKGKSPKAGADLTAFGAFAG